jgi:hypothetical protein
VSAATFQAMPAPPSLPPFDPPSETLSEAVSEQLDFAARLDVVERKLDAQAERQRLDSAKLSSLQADVGRVADAGTAHGLTLDRVERAMGEVRTMLKKMLAGARG